MVWQNAPARVSADWPAADWWRSFGSAQLDDYIALAQSGNDDIAAAIARVREADALARIAGAALLPTLDAGAAASRQRQLVASGGPPVTYNEYLPAVTASYALDFWGKNRATRDAALDQFTGQRRRAHAAAAAGAPADPLIQGAS